MLPNSEDDLYDASHGVLSSEFDRVEGVTDGVHCADRYELDPWQAFAYHIVARRYRESLSLSDRCFFTGSAGTGKLRTVRSFVSFGRVTVLLRL